MKTVYMAKAPIENTPKSMQQIQRTVKKMDGKNESFERVISNTKIFLWKYLPDNLIRVMKRACKKLFQGGKTYGGNAVAFFKLKTTNKS